MLGSGAIAQQDTATVEVVNGNCRARLTLAEVRALPQVSATITAHDGTAATYQGPLLKDVLLAACPDVAAIQKKEMVRCAVRLEAADDYRAVIALAEADTAFRAHPVLLAVLCDGLPLNPKNGPFQAIVPDDTRHARDVRMVVRLVVVRP